MGFARFTLLVGTCLLSAASTARAQSSQVEGIIDGVFGPQGAQYIEGWACEVGNPNPLLVHLFY